MSQQIAISSQDAVCQAGQFNRPDLHQANDVTRDAPIKSTIQLRDTTLLKKVAQECQPCLVDIFTFSG